MKDAILNYLTEEPRFRERVNKNKGIANIISGKYGIDMPKDKRNDIIADILNADRYWRKHTADHPNLRGKDYGTKEAVEQEFELSLGYEPLISTPLKQF